MKNLKIRSAATAKDVRLWEVAERAGISVGHFSRKLRKELPDDEQERILNIIDDIADMKKNNNQ